MDAKAWGSLGLGNAMKGPANSSRVFYNLLKLQHFLHQLAANSIYVHHSKEITLFQKWSFSFFVWSIYDYLAKSMELMI